MSGPWQPLLLQVSTDSTNFAIFRRFYNIGKFLQFSQKLQFSSGRTELILLQVFPDLTKFTMFCRFYNIRNFRRNRSSCRGPLNPFLYTFSLSRQNLQCFANFTIFAIFAVFANKEVLLGAVSTSSLTGFLCSFCKNRSSPRAHSIFFLQGFPDSTNFTIFRKFYNIMNFRKRRSSCWGPLKPFFNRFSLTRRVFQFFPHFKIFAIFAAFAKIAVLHGPSHFFSTGFS